MPNSLNFISEFPAQAGRYKATGKGHGTDKAAKTDPDASAMAAMTDQFSHVLHKVTQQQPEPAEKHHKNSINGKTEKTDTARNTTGSESAETREPDARTQTTEAPTQETAKTDEGNDTSTLADQSDKPVEATNAQPDFSSQLTALTGTMQTLLANTSVPETTPSGTSESSILPAAIATTAGSLTIANMPLQQNLQTAPNTQTANTAPTTALDGTNPSNQGVTNQPGSANAPEANFSQTLEQAANPSEDPSANQPGSTSLATLSATDLSVIPSPESLPLPTLPKSPNKAELDGPNAATSPLPGLGTGSTEKAPTPGEGNKSAMQSLSSISEKLQALNGKIEGLSDSGNDDNASTGDTLNAITPSQPDISANSLLAAGVNGPQANIHSTQGAGENPLTQFVSNAQQPIDQVADGTLYSIKNGQKELVIRLNPDNLGEVRINLISHGNQEMSARLIASTPESHEILKSQVDSLRNTLEAQGLQVERLSVVLAGSPESARDFNQNGHQHQSHQNEQNTAHNNQHAFNQQDQPNPNLFNQLGGQFQHKQGFAQQPGGNRTGGFNNGASVLGDTAGKADTPARSNENGNISLLA